MKQRGTTISDGHSEAYVQVTEYGGDRDEAAKGYGGSVQMGNWNKDCGGM